MGKLWNSMPLPSEEASSRDFGPLRIWCKTYHGDLWLGHRHPKAGRPHPDDVPDDLEWTRWPLQNGFEELRFSPALPDRPVVIQMEAPFVLTPDAKARVYVRCPLWVKVTAGNGKHEVELTEIPTVVLSNTWFGVTTEGELCYWLSSSGRRQYSLDENRLYQAVCPLSIVNKFDEPLDVNKICLRVPGHTLFIDDQQLWADESRIEYRGGNRVSHIHATGKPPEEAPDAREITKPRDPEKSNLVARTFLSLKHLPGLGLLTG